MMKPLRTLAILAGFCAALCVLLVSFSKRQTAPVAVNASGATIASRFATPAGYTRIVAEKNSFAEFLQNTALKPAGALVHYFDGREKPNKVAATVLALDVGDKNLQQCADAVMRLRAEYLYKARQYQALHFNFTNGFDAKYEKWREGYRISVKGNTATWVKTAEESTSYKSFRSYLNTVFTYAGTASLSKELKAVPLSQMQIGDVLIKGGSPGHAVIVVDMAIDAKTNKKLFMIAQSYMPAQDIHVLVNLADPALSPWYALDGSAGSIYTPEWTFGAEELKRF